MPRRMMIRASSRLLIVPFAVNLFFIAYESFAREPVVNPNPSIKEFRGLYNVPPDAEGAADGAECLQVAANATTLPPWSEIERVLKGLGAVAEEIASPRGQNRKAMKDAVQCDAGFNDRTALLHFKEIRHFRLPVCEKYRDFLHEHEPLWRLVVEGQSLDTTIVIYPTAIILPDGSVATEETFSKLLEAEERLRDRTQYAHERQWELVQQRLKRIAGESGLAKPFDPVVLAAFREHRGRPGRLAVWILEDGDPFDKTSWLDPEVFPAFKGEDHARDVDTAGRAHAYYSGRLDIVGRVFCCVCSKEDWENRVILKSPVDGKITAISVPDKEVIEDEALRRALLDK